MTVRGSRKHHRQLNFRQIAAHRKHHRPLNFRQIVVHRKHHRQLNFRQIAVHRREHYFTNRKITGQTNMGKVRGRGKTNELLQWLPVDQCQSYVQSN